MTLTVVPVQGIPEITEGADLAGLIAEVATGLADGDILVITSKIVSKAEGRVARVAVERAGAADLLKGKAAGIPVAVVRVLGDLVTEAEGPGAQALIPPTAEDMFRYGSADVLAARRTVRDFTGDPVDPAA